MDSVTRGSMGIHFWCALSRISSQKMGKGVSRIGLDFGVGGGKGVGVMVGR